MDLSPNTLVGMNIDEAIHLLASNHVSFRIRFHSASPDVKDFVPGTWTIEYNRSDVVVKARVDWKKQEKDDGAINKNADR